MVTLRMVQSGTAAAAAAGFTVGSTIAYVAPHMAGAIDVIVVQQPDGSRKSSPFYGNSSSSAQRVVLLF